MTFVPVGEDYRNRRITVIALLHRIQVDQQSLDFHWTTTKIIDHVLNRSNKLATNGKQEVSSITRLRDMVQIVQVAMIVTLIYGVRYSASFWVDFCRRIVDAAEFMLGYRPRPVYLIPGQFCSTVVSLFTYSCAHPSFIHVMIGASRTHKSAWSSSRWPFRSHTPPLAICESTGHCDSTDRNI